MLSPFLVTENDVCQFRNPNTHQDRKKKDLQQEMTLYKHHLISNTLWLYLFDHAGVCWYSCGKCNGKRNFRRAEKTCDYCWNGCRTKEDIIHGRNFDRIRHCNYLSDHQGPSRFVPCARGTFLQCINTTMITQLWIKFVVLQNVCNASVKCQGQDWGELHKIFAVHILKYMLSWKTTKTAALCWCINLKEEQSVYKYLSHYKW